MSSRQITILLSILLISFFSIFPGLTKDSDSKDWQQGELVQVQTKEQMRTQYISMGTLTTIPEDQILKYYFLTVRVGLQDYLIRFERDRSDKFSLPWKNGDKIWLKIKKDKMTLKTPEGKKIKTKIIRIDHVS